MEDSLFAQARNGDTRSIAVLVEQYYRLAYSTAFDWIRKGLITKDDGISEANMALMKCIRGKYNPEKGAFAPYVVKAVDNQIRVNLRQRKQSRKMQYVDSYVMLEDGPVEAVALVEDCGDSVEEMVEASMMVHLIVNMLQTDKKIRPLEAQCLLMRMDGMTCDEVAERLAMSQSGASHLSNSAVKKVRTRLREVGGL